jgi:predicted lysophospholipase L1 biosynthesis ABC-type transport system permease subunit
VHSYSLSFALEAAPGVALVLVGFLAAMPPYALLRQGSHGRARSAISYLCGLGIGLFATALLAATLKAHITADAIVAPGLFSAFFAPFAGLARAKWDGPRKKQRRAPIGRALTQ